VLEYIQSLAKPERARVLEGLEQVERRGLDAVRVQFRHIEGKLWEVKIGSHRVFYVIIEKEEMVLLHAYKKTRPETAGQGTRHRHSKNEGVVIMKAKRKRIALKDVLKRELKDPEFSFYYRREKAISEIAQLVRDARLRAGLTQAQLAEKAQSSQVVIARLESGSDDRVPSLDLLERIAGALKAKLLVRFEYKKVA
jgi:ribosome-binding protein aMBF1 (putative translation factor)